MEIISAISYFPVKIPWAQHPDGSSIVLSEFFIGAPTPGIEKSNVEITQTPSGHGIMISCGDEAIFVPMAMVILKLSERKIASVRLI